jgi:hypothetical protein
MIRGTQNAVKLDYAVECTAVPDPSVHRLAPRFLRFRMVAGDVNAFSRVQRRANHFDATCMGAPNQLPVSTDHIFVGKYIGWIRQRKVSQFGTKETNIVQAFEQHDVRYSRQAYDVTIKARERTGHLSLASVAQEAIPADVVFHDRHL